MIKIREYLVQYSEKKRKAVFIKEHSLFKKLGTNFNDGMLKFLENVRVV